MDAADETQIAPAAFLGAYSAIRSEAEFIAALRRRKEELGITLETVDAISGQTARYASKLLTGKRPIGALCFWPLLETFGFYIQLIPDPAVIERLRKHLEWRPKSYTRGRRFKLAEIAIARRRNSPWLLNTESARKIGSLGGIATAKKRYAIASKSAIYRANALKRWRKI